METGKPVHPARVAWNKGKLIGQKPALKLPEIWAIRVRLQLSPSPVAYEAKLTVKEPIGLSEIT